MNVWRFPLALAALSLFGLLVALVGDGAADVAGWVALAAPVLAVATFVTPAIQRRRLVRRDSSSHLET